MAEVAKHLCWSDSPVDRPMPLLERRRMIGEKAMISHITLSKGCNVPMHSHENEQFSCVISGCLRFGVKDGLNDARRDVLVRAGEALHLPSNVPHCVVAEEETVVLDIFSPPSQGTGIDRAGAEG
jgi:quercetin dioxygenase-like cupin family protein